MIKTTIGFALLATTFLSSAASAFDITTDDLLEKLSNSPNVSWEEVGEDKKMKQMLLPSISPTTKPNISGIHTVSRTVMK